MSGAEPGAIAGTSTSTNNAVRHAGAAAGTLGNDSSAAGPGATDAAGATASMSARLMRPDPAAGDHARVTCNDYRTHATARAEYLRSAALLASVTYNTDRNFDEAVADLAAYHARMETAAATAGPRRGAGSSAGTTGTTADSMAVGSNGGAANRAGGARGGTHPGAKALPLAGAGAAWTPQRRARHTHQHQALYGDAGGEREPRGERQPERTAADAARIGQARAGAWAFAPGRWWMAGRAWGGEGEGDGAMLLGGDEPVPRSAEEEEVSTGGSWQQPSHRAQLGGSEA